MVNFGQLFGFALKILEVIRYFDARLIFIPFFYSF